MNNVIQGTVRELNARYEKLSDDMILGDIRTGICAGESLFYLQFGRYASMLETIFSMQATKAMDFDDFMLELNIHLFKNECKAIRCYNSEKASFKTYLSTIARNLLYDIREKELPFLDVDGLENVLYDHFDGENVMLLVDEINDYPDKDSRYVLLKTIEGYKSKEIAAMLTDKKHEEGVLDENKELKPSYIDTLRSRALRNIKKHIMRIQERQRDRYDSAATSKCVKNIDYFKRMEECTMAMPEDSRMLKSPILMEKCEKIPSPNNDVLFIRNIMEMYDMMKNA